MLQGLTTQAIRGIDSSINRFGYCTRTRLYQKSLIYKSALLQSYNKLQHWLFNINPSPHRDISPLDQDFENVIDEEEKSKWRLSSGETSLRPDNFLLSSWLKEKSWPNVGWCYAKMTMTRIAQSRQRDRDGVGLPVRDRRSAPIAASRRGRSSFLTTQSICNTHAVCVIIERRSQEMESNRPVPAKKEQLELNHWETAFLSGRNDSIAGSPMY